MLRKKSKIAAIVTCIALIGSIAAGMAGCAAKVDTGNWSVNVSGVSGVSTYTSTDAQKLTAYTLEATVTDKTGSSVTNKYTGVRLKDVLNAMGVKSYNSIVLTSSDGYSVTYDTTVASSDNTLLAWAKDGTNMDSSAGGPVKACPTGQTGNMFLKSVASITVN